MTRFYRILYKRQDEQRFHEGTFFTNEQDAIDTVKNYEHVYQCGYLEIDDPNKE